MRQIRKGYLTASLLGLVLLIFGGMMFARYQREMRAIRERIAEMDSQVIQTSHGLIEYVQVGTGDPVLVIHGNGGGFDQGLLLAQGYLGPEFQVIAPSRFGYLRTPLPDGASPELQADAYASLLDALGVQQVAVFTSSAGVTSAIQFALRHPERVSAMILHSPNAPGRVDMALPPLPVFNAMLRSDFTYWLLTTYFGSGMQSLVGVPKGFALTTQYQADVNSTLASVLPSSSRAAGMVFDTYTGNQTVNQIPLEQVQTPTLVISAVDDPMALYENARSLAARIPGAELMSVGDGGHMMLGHTEEVRGEVASFLQKTAADVRIVQ